MNKVEYIGGYILELRNVTSIFDDKVYDITNLIISLSTFAASKKERS